MKLFNVVFIPTKNYSYPSFVLAKFIQSIVVPPYKLKHYPNSVIKLEINPNFTKSKRALFIRRSCCTLVVFFNQFVLFRILWLCATYNSAIIPASVVEQLILNLQGLCLSALALLFQAVTQALSPQICYLLTQRFLVVPISKPHYAHPTVSIADILVYGVSFFVALIPIFSFIVPLKLPYGPLQILFRYLYPEITIAIKVAFGTILSFCTAYFAGQMLYSFLLTIVGLDAIQDFSTNLCDIQQNSPMQTYNEKYREYRILQLILQFVNSVIGNFGLIVAFFGVLLASTCCYCTVKMHGKLPLVAQLVTTGMVVLFFCLDFILGNLAEVPNSSGKNFLRLWTCGLAPGYEFRLGIHQIKSCPDVGYNIGPQMIVEKGTALVIANLAVEWTVNILLLE